MKLKMLLVHVLRHSAPSIAGSKGVSLRNLKQILHIIIKTRFHVEVSTRISIRNTLTILRLPMKYTIDLLILVITVA